MGSTNPTSTTGVQHPTYKMIEISPTNIGILTSQHMLWLMFWSVDLPTGILDSGKVFLGPPGHWNIRNPIHLYKHTATTFKYTNWYFILLRGLSVWPALHIFKCRYRSYLVKITPITMFHDTYINSSIFYGTFSIATLNNQRAYGKTSGWSKKKPWSFTFQGMRCPGDDQKWSQFRASGLFAQSLWLQSIQTIHFKT